MKKHSLHLLFILVALFFTGTSYAQTIHITVSPNDTICQGVSTTFTATITGTGTPGYKWQLNSAAISGATTSTYTTTTLVNHDTISCLLTNSVGATVATSNNIVMTVDSLPVISPIIGLDSVCVGSHVQLSDTTSGGVWSVTTPTAATISTTGLLTGLATSNNNRAVYKLTNLCGSDSLRFRVRVQLGAGPVMGVSTLCIDSTTLLSDVTRGTWSTSDSNIAKFINQFGFLQGQMAGTITIYDAVANACGSSIDSTTMTIIDCGEGVPALTTLSKAVHVFPNPNTGTFNLLLGGNYTSATCLISNILGEKVREFEISSGKQTELTLVHSGIYFITVSAGNEHYSSKIVVMQ